MPVTPYQSEGLASDREQTAIAALLPRSLSEIVPQSTFNHDSEFSLAYYGRLIRKHAWILTALVLVSTTVVGLITLRLKKEYDAFVTVRIDSSSTAFSSQHDLTSGGAIDPQLLVVTEENVVTSPAVVSNTIKALHLDQFPEFQPKKVQPGDVHLMTPAIAQEILTNVTKHIQVTRPPGTLLLEIHFRSQNPERAALVANTLAREFIENDYRSHAEALNDASKTMSRQLDQLQAQMERDQTALVRYQAKQDVVDPDDKTNIMQARLTQLNQQLGTAEAERINLDAQYQTALAQGIDGLIQSGPQESLGGQPLYAIQQRVQQDQRTLARLGQVYGPKHPVYRQQEAVLQHDQDVLTHESHRLLDQLKKQDDAAITREQLVRRALEQQKRALDEFDLKAISYHSLKAAADSSTKLYYDLQQQIQDANVAANLHSENLRIISPARPDYKPVYPRPLLATIMTFLVSLLMGAGGIIAIGLLDNSVSKPEEIELLFHVPVIVSLPDVNPEDEQTLVLDNGKALQYLAYQTSPPGASDSSEPRRNSPFREAILSLYSSLMFSKQGTGHLLSISSALPGEGKSTVATNLAEAFAALAGKTVLVDADMRKPSVHRRLGLRNRIGLSSVLMGTATLDECLVRAGEGALTVLPAGPCPPSPAETLQLGFAGLLDELCSRFDNVIIDCPPALGFADAAVIASHVDRVLLVIHAGKTRREHIGAAIRQITSAGGKILGIACNRVSSKVNGYYDYYRKYSNYYGPDDSVED